MLGGAAGILGEDVAGFLSNASGLTGNSAAAQQNYKGYSRFNDDFEKEDIVEDLSANVSLEADDEYVQMIIEQGNYMKLDEDSKDEDDQKKGKSKPNKEDSDEEDEDEEGAVRDSEGSASERHNKNDKNADKKPATGATTNS